jgi:hypothetical protein
MAWPTAPIDQEVRNMETPEDGRERDPEQRGEPGAEGESDAGRKPPPAPSEDDPSPLGDTDQHSGADA